MAKAKVQDNRTQIEFEGTKITLPADPRKMSYKDAVETIMAVAKQEETEVMVIEEFNAFVFDAAWAFNQAMKRRYGVALQEAVQTFFGSRPPITIGVETDFGVTEQIPWGRTTLPGMEGHIDMQAVLRDGRVVLSIAATVKRKFEAQIREIANDTREILRKESIYRGKSFSMVFEWPDGDPMQVQPKFLNVKEADEDRLILPRRVENAVKTNLFGPLENFDRLHEIDKSFKRGVLLAGQYGTGKTMSAHIAAKKANQHGITFLMVKDPKEFAKAVAFARQYEPCVVFCEDIDRVTSGERSISLDEILNIVDGIDSKNTKIMVVLTTNNSEAIHAAMLRPGRLDVVIDYEKPDAEAALRLILQYGGNSLVPNTDLTEAAHLLAGNIPAVIQEVVERSKLAALRMTPRGEKILISGEALVDSAETMRMQLRLLNREVVREPSNLERMGHSIGVEIGKAIKLLAAADKDSVDTLGVRDDGNWEMVEREDIPRVPQGVRDLLDEARL